MFNLIKNIIGGSPKNDESHNYKEYKIIPKPIRNGGSFTTEGKIIKDTDEYQEAYFIRTDTFSKKEDAVDCIIRKAKIIIDENGDKIFEKDWL